MEEKPDVTMQEEHELETGSAVHGQKSDALARMDTVDINNYHGLSAKVFVVFACVCLNITAQLALIVGAGAFAKTITDDFDASAYLVWPSQIAAIMTVILGPILSQAADLWGRKWFLVGSTVFAFIGCIISSRATSINMFLAGQGLACVIFGAQPIVYSVASEIVPRRYRPAAQGIMNFCGGTGAVIALIGGFAMIENITGGWRVFYYTFTAIFIISAIAFAVLYNPPPRPLQNTLSTGQKLARLDWIAYFLLASGMLLFVIGLSWADDPYSWSSAHVLAPLLVGIALIGLLAVHQSFFKKDGLMHHDLFSKDRNFALAAVVIFLDGAVFFSCTNYYPLEIALVFLATDVQVGVHFAIAFIAAIVSSMLVAVYSSKTKDIRSPIIVSFVFFACFFAGMTTVTVNSTKTVYGLPVLLGFGFGMSLTCLVTIAQLSTPPRLIAVTSGLIISIRSLGASVGLAIYTSIFDSKLDAVLADNIAAAVLPLGLSTEYLGEFIGGLADDDVALLETIPGISFEIIEAGLLALQNSYLEGLKNVWIAAAALSAAAVVLSFFFAKSKSITMHVDAPLEEEEMMH